MKKKTKKLIKALEARLETVEIRSKLTRDFINDMYEAQTKWLIAKWNGEVFEDFKTTL